MTEEEPRKDHLVRIAPELFELFQLIRKNIEKYAWGIDMKVSNYNISKILAKKVKDRNIL